ncbi:zinc ribbon domain-containing protein [uncultured Methanobrevibacter sp.]|uniref:zinc ribbon domain-containing protein n=1 Tax=uncultured Methanobrevibacter sp. TaxID=253161 RepID=UPI0025DA1001|nr:zinc ribbon domain-containing protein [uncultured Methanobrevibacter sp.]
MVKKCPYCGSSLVDNVEACPYCGIHLESSNNISIDNSQNFVAKLTNFDFKNKKVPILLVIILLIIDGAVILTLYGNNVEFTVLSAECTHSPTNPSQYVLRANIMLYQVPSNLDEYSIRQTYYDKYNTRIGSSTESLASHSSWLMDTKYNVDHVIYLKSVVVNKKPHPDHVYRVSAKMQFLNFGSKFFHMKFNIF